MKHEITIKNLADLDRAAKVFLAEIGSRKLLAFHGQMGAGKTTFISALCKALGIEDNVCSPTFTIVNEYLDRKGDAVFHFDFYRIRNVREAMDIGLEDYFYSGSLCIIEWPENVVNLLPDNTTVIDISVNPDQSRSLIWEDAD